MERDALDFFAQVAAEFRRLGVTPAEEAAGTVEFSMPAGEYLALGRGLPDGAGWAAVETRLRALLPPDHGGAWDRGAAPHGPAA
jgi:hypothetical protein